MWVMHCLPMKLCPMFRWVFSARGHRAVVALTIVEMMIDVSIEMIRSVEPGSCPYEYTA